MMVTLMLMMMMRTTTEFASPHAFIYIYILALFDRFLFPWTSVNHQLLPSFNHDSTGVLTRPWALSLNSAPSYAVENGGGKLLFTTVHG